MKYTKAKVEVEYFNETVFMSGSGDNISGSGNSGLAIDDAYYGPFQCSSVEYKGLIWLEEKYGWFGKYECRKVSPGNPSNRPYLYCQGVMEEVYIL